MRTKFLLFLSLLTFGILNAQVDDTIRTLIISEARLDDARSAYVEISNVGTTTLNLQDFSIGIIGAWTVPWSGGRSTWTRFPDYELAPGGTYIVAAWWDFNREMAKQFPEDYDPGATNKLELGLLPGLLIDLDEYSGGNPQADSVHPQAEMMTLWSGRDCIYLRYHIGGDSAVIDQVNGIFDGTGGNRAEAGPVDVAGVTDATSTCTLFRKFSIKSGELDFAGKKGEDLTESSWIPIPHQLSGGGNYAENIRRLYWATGNHGDYNLESTTLVPLTDAVDFQWDAQTITVPWGTRRDDSIIFMFERVPGIAWHYDYVDSYQDSAYVSARTGDTLTVYAVGNDLDTRKFHIIVAEPTEDAKIVVPMKAPNEDGFFEGVSNPLYTVSDGLELDTIGDLRFGGIAFATRVDTLLKYLEKPVNASWEIVWKDDLERTDLLDGDKLKVIAQDLSEKEYYIKVDRHRKSHNANLSMITWPDIPAEFVGMYNWSSDTIPGFVKTSFDYIAQIHPDFDGIPALVGKTEDLNAKLKVSIATNLSGGIADKTVTFNATAEDDTSKRTYTVQLVKQRAAENIQPWDGDAFISEWVFWEQWGANNWIEVANPRPIPIDMSNYMFVVTWANTPAEAITTRSADVDWLNRYRRYVPGYKWVDSLAWVSSPSMLEPDLNVNPFVQPGDVFLFSTINSTWAAGYPWWASTACDVILSQAFNPWGENIGEGIAHWNNANIFMFKILNDSIKAGTKAAIDPPDFQVIDLLGNMDGTTLTVGGVATEMISTIRRKPEIYKGNPVVMGSQGTTPENSEWDYFNIPWQEAHGNFWPNNILYCTKDVGQHFMNEATIFKSTVTSSLYKVSLGYSLDELIRGVVDATTVSSFMGNIIKANPDQYLKVQHAGVVLGDADVVVNNDSLIVVSSDSVNTTIYKLEVTAGGLSGDAVLTSDIVTITAEETTGVVGGFDYGITLDSLLSTIEVPAGATFIAFDDSTDGYASLRMLNFDTIYVDVLVNDRVSFRVTSENGLNTIVYQLEPNAAETDAFVTSSVFGVDDYLSLIYLVPEGLSAPEFLNQLIPSLGATIRLEDKLGFDRVAGNVVSDDRLVVTAGDGVTTKTYEITVLGEFDVDQLAYVISEIYVVDQDALIIQGETINNAMTVAAFKANIVAAPGAIFDVTNSAGVPKTSGNLAIGDLVIVISADGLVTRTYEIDVINAVDNPLQSKIAVYPNPSKGNFTLSGVAAGNRIQVINIVGAMVLDKYAAGDKEPVRIENEQSGIYFITVSDNDKVIGRFKVVKE